MSWRDRVHLLHRLQNILIDPKNTLDSTSMDRFESNRTDLIGRLKASRLGIGQLFNARLDRDPVMRNSHLEFAFAISDLHNARLKSEPIRSTPPRANCVSVVMSNKRYLKEVDPGSRRVPSWPTILCDGSYLKKRRAQTFGGTRNDVGN